MAGNLDPVPCWSALCFSVLHWHLVGQPLFQEVDCIPLSLKYTVFNEQRWVKSLLCDYRTEGSLYWTVHNPFVSGNSPRVTSQAISLTAFHLHTQPWGLRPIYFYPIFSPLILHFISCCGPIATQPGCWGEITARPQCSSLHPGRLVTMSHSQAAGWSELTARPQ